MKKINTLLLLIICPLWVFGQTDTTLVRNYELSRIESKIDSINNEAKLLFSSVSNEVNELKKSNSRLSEKNNHLQGEVNSAHISISRLKDSLEVYRELIQSNTDIGGDNANAIKDNQNELQTAITQTNIAIVSGDTKLKTNISTRTFIGIIALCFSVILSVILALLLYRRSKTDISKLKEQAESLNKKIVEKLTSEATEISKITSVISNTTPDVDHSLIKTIADRITFMEMTLYKMDSSIRGHKQLSKSIKQMKDNLLANGYELVDMLGKPYHEGMKVVANFTEDETLKDNEQIISGIIKPQINYNGVMIQSAQITVSQN